MVLISTYLLTDIVRIELYYRGDNDYSIYVIDYRGVKVVRKLVNTRIKAYEQYKKYINEYL